MYQHCLAHKKIVRCALVVLARVWRSITGARVQVSGDASGRIFALMRKAAAIGVEFGEPRHGWLPVTFRASNFHLQVNASLVPANPLDALCETIALVLAGSPAQVLWFSEPAECWFHFENQANKITLTISERTRRGQALTQLFQVTGTTEEIVKPLLQALTQFSARAYSETHWPKPDSRRLLRLRNLLQTQL